MLHGIMLTSALCDCNTIKRAKNSLKEICRIKAKPQACYNKQTNKLVACIVTGKCRDLWQLLSLMQC